MDINLDDLKDKAADVLEGAVLASCLATRLTCLITLIWMTLRTSYQDCLEKIKQQLMDDMLDWVCRLFSHPEH